MNATTTVVRWSELLKREFEQRIEACPVVYLPMGLCEPHGHIAALGLDLTKAEYLCCEAATRWGGIVAPSQGYHIHETGYHAPWLEEVLGNVNPYMTSTPPSPVLYFFLYQLRTFHNAGFEQAIVITGHSGGNQFDLRRVADAFMKISDMKVEVFSDPELTNGKYAGDHAGKYELSQLLSIAPEQVDLNRVAEWKESNASSRFAQGEDGGDATEDYGKQIMEDCLAGIQRLLQSKKVKDDNVSSRHRTLLHYDLMESTWHKIKQESKQWTTHNLRQGQAQTPLKSIWSAFEKWAF